MAASTLSMARRRVPRMPRSCHLSCRGAQWPDCDQRGPCQRCGRPRAEVVPVPRREQYERRNFHQRACARTCGYEHSTSRLATICSLTFPPTMRSRSVRSTFREPFATVWENQHVFDLVARNPLEARAGITTRSRAIRRLRIRCGLTSALRRLLPARTATRRRIELLFQSQTWRRCFRHRSLRRLSHQADAAGDGLHRWGRRHGSVASPPIASSRDRANCTENQLLVRRALKAGNLLRGLFPGI